MSRRKISLVKWIFISVFGLIFVAALGLVINNRICAMKYNQLETAEEHLTKEEISAVGGVYEYLDERGDEIFTKLKNDKDLIIYNERYEFLICDDEKILAWDFIGKNQLLDKNIHRRKAENPQAFAVFVGDKWVGSMSTKNYYNKFIIKQIPVFFPPQVMLMDEEHYKATIIHEMVHAFEAKHNKERFLEIESLHSVGEKYYDNSAFNDLIVKEASYLEQAIAAKDPKDVSGNVKKFLETRNRRRKECEMSKPEIQNEINLEWLEGLARYAEFKASRNSTGIVAENLGDIDQKVKVKGDDRYYTLGMAQALVLDKLDKDWKNEIFEDKFSMEDYLKEITETNRLVNR
jgi:hypothetical protein